MRKQHFIDNVRVAGMTPIKETRWCLHAHPLEHQQGRQNHTKSLNQKNHSSDRCLLRIPLEHGLCAILNSSLVTEAVDKVDPITVLVSVCAGAVTTNKIFGFYPDQRFATGPCCLRVRRWRFHRVRRRRGYG